LMKLFAGPKTLALLSRFGMKEGDAIEHGMITRAVERAQRKVEERNFEIRKNLLEYDEVMEYQRNAFYGLRQAVLAGRDIPRVIFDYITDSVEDAVAFYLDKDYVPSQIAEWCRQALDVNIESFKLRETDLPALQAAVFSEARDDVRQTIEVTLGEYMSNEMPPEDWDLRGLTSWAMSRFSVDLKQNQARKMNPEEVRNLLTEAALEQLTHKDLAPLAKFLVPNYAQADLANWARMKFSIEIEADELAAHQQQEQVAPFILEKAHAAYERRAVVYPVEFALEMTFQMAKSNGRAAAEQLAAWANQRYDLKWDAEQISKLTGNQLQEQLLAEAEAWARGGKLETLVDQVLSQHSDAEKLAQWAQERFGQLTEATELADAATRRQVLLDKGRAMLRAELTHLERYVLLQILDMAWKDHLYAMDQLKDSIGLRGYAERDPRIEYKREGSFLFNQMQQVVRDRVTDLTFRARLTTNTETRNVYGDQQAEHAEAASVLSKGSAEKQADLDAAEQAGSNAEHLSRRARRAAAATSADTKESAPKHPQFKERKRRR
jgi:preprotein translocase subunit SecA